MAITIIVTNAGRAALVNAANTGTNAVTITQLGVTAAVFVPNAAQVALPGEIKRIASLAGLVVANDQIHITARDVTTDAYAMRGFGLYLADGTLFAIYGQVGPILNKTAESMMLLAADIAFADIDAEMIVFGDTNFILPPATTEILGLVELATTSEAQTGSDAVRVLTPLTGKQSVLGWLLSQDGSGSGLDADLLDGLHASAFATAGHTHGTMAAQNANAVAITGGAINGTTVGAATPSTGRFTTVGIGAAPAAPLHVATSGNNVVLVKDAAHSSFGQLTAAMTFSRPDGVTDLAAIFGCNGGGLAVTGRNGVAFATGGDGAYSATVERARITDTGEFNVGYPVPVGGSLAVFNRDQNSPTHVITRNADPGAGAFAGFSLNAYGNSWAMRMGSIAANSNALQWDVDYIGAPATRMTLTSAGSLGLGTTNPLARSDVAATNPTRGVVAIIRNTALAGQSGCQLEFTQAAIANWTIGQPAGLNAFAFFAGRSTGSDGAEVMRLTTGGASILGNAVWHAGNDGSGSGLDADLLDGQQGAYYLPAASYTAADVRTKLLGVDGVGSGIDADLLDGQQGAYYLPAASYTAADVLAKMVGVDGVGSGLDADLLDGQQGAYYLPAASYTAADVLAKMVGVDGSGSGLDADLLDGYHASSFDRIVQQNLTAEGGYIVYASGRKECWGTVFVAQDSYTTWNLPIAHTNWAHPSFCYTGKAGVNNTADNTMFAGFIGAPPTALRFWNAEDTSLTIYVRTVGV